MRHIALFYMNNIRVMTMSTDLKLKEKFGVSRHCHYSLHIQQVR